MTHCLFYFDNLSLVISFLVFWVWISVISFSLRHLSGDKNKKLSLFYMSLLVATVFVIINANNLILLLCSWIISNILLTRLMLHKNNWQAAKESSKLALKNFILSWIFIVISFGTLYWNTKTMCIQRILITPISYYYIICADLCLFIGIMIQSGVWPFHRWLLSSLNSPTPVSALMHAGIINGGGFILARFAPLFLEQQLILQSIFIVGILTAILGTLWKLMQNNFKNMLACSTMGQMGFMLVQFGLGLFPAAIAHLCWHGLFKAYLFLSSGSAAQETRIKTPAPSIANLFLAIICGIIGAYMFSVLSKKHIAPNTTIILLFIAMIAGAQIALPILNSNAKFKFYISAIVCTIMGTIYGFNIYLIQVMLYPLNLNSPQPISIAHVAAILILTSAWLLVVYKSRLKVNVACKNWLLKFYVYMLNACQPHPKTITSHRNQYQF